MTDGLVGVDGVTFTVAFADLIVGDGAVATQRDHETLDLVEV